MLDVNPWYHCQVVHNLIRHVFDISLNVLIHKLYSSILKVLNILVSFTIFSNTSNQNQYFLLSSVKQLHISLIRHKWIDGSKMSFCFLFLFDVGLDENNVRVYPSYCWVLKLFFAKQLHISIFIPDWTKWLIFIQFVLLYWLDK